MSFLTLGAVVGILGPPALAEDLPPPPERPVRQAPPAPPPRPAFAGDAIVGWTIGSLAAPSVTAKASGSLLVRYDAFATRRSTGGARLGLSFWGAFSTPPQTSWSPEAGEVTRSDESDVPVDLTDPTLKPRRYGIMAVLRHDPAARISADFGLGFGRLDLDASPWGRAALPSLTVEAGLRHKLPMDRAFVTWTARGSWIETPSSAAGWPAEEWWFVELGPCIGYGVQTGGR